LVWQLGKLVSLQKGMFENGDRVYPFLFGETRRF